MKYIIVLSVLALLSALLYWRLRPYIKMARRVLGVVRDVRRMSVGQETADLPRSQKTRGVAEKLVRCDACGVWL